MCKLLNKFTHNKYTPYVNYVHTVQTGIIACFTPIYFEQTM